MRQRETDLGGASQAGGQERGQVGQGAREKRANEKDPERRKATQRETEECAWCRQSEHVIIKTSCGRERALTLN
jgi:hypothetical protein